MQVLGESCHSSLALEMQISALTGSNCVWCADLIVLVPTGVISTYLLNRGGGGNSFFSKI